MTLLHARLWQYFRNDHLIFHFDIHFAIFNQLICFFKGVMIGINSLLLPVITRRLLVSCPIIKTFILIFAIFLFFMQVSRILILTHPKFFTLFLFKKLQLINFTNPFAQIIYARPFIFFILDFSSISRRLLSKLIVCNGFFAYVRPHFSEFRSFKLSHFILS